MQKASSYLWLISPHTEYCSKPQNVIQRSILLMSIFNYLYQSSLTLRLINPFNLWSLCAPTTNSISQFINGFKAQLFRRPSTLLNKTQFNLVLWSWKECHLPIFLLSYLEFKHLECRWLQCSFCQIEEYTIPSIWSYT